jgi:hypothetical protein
VLDRIATTASPRSSLIISDEALSAETGKGTEFVAVLGNEPQGGLAMRRHGQWPELRYARQHAGSIGARLLGLCFPLGEARSAAAAQRARPASANISAFKQIGAARRYFLYAPEQASTHSNDVVR